MNNKDIRNSIQHAGLNHWEIADQLKIHEGTFSRMLRKELPEDRKKEVKEAIRRAEEELNSIN